jgi:hypothetical protein
MKQTSLCFWNGLIVACFRTLFLHLSYGGKAGQYRDASSDPNRLDVGAIVWRLICGLDDRGNVVWIRRFFYFPLPTGWPSFWTSLVHWVPETFSESKAVGVWRWPLASSAEALGRLGWHGAVAVDLNLWGAQFRSFYGILWFAFVVCLIPSRILG